MLRSDHRELVNIKEKLRANNITAFVLSLRWSYKSLSMYN